MRDYLKHSNSWVPPIKLFRKPLICHQVPGYFEAPAVHQPTPNLIVALNQTGLWAYSIPHSPPSLIVLVTGKASQEVQWCAPLITQYDSWLFSRQLLSAAISFSANVTGYTSSFREFDHFMRFESSLVQHRNPKADPHSHLWRFTFMRLKSHNEILWAWFIDIRALHQ